MMFYFLGALFAIAFCTGQAVDDSGCSRFLKSIKITFYRWTFKRETKANSKNGQTKLIDKMFLHSTFFYKYDDLSPCKI